MQKICFLWMIVLTISFIFATQVKARILYDAKPHPNLTLGTSFSWGSGPHADTANTCYDLEIKNTSPSTPKNLYRSYFYDEESQYRRSASSSRHSSISGGYGGVFSASYAQGSTFQQDISSQDTILTFRMEYEAIFEHVNSEVTLKGAYQELVDKPEQFLRKCGTDTVTGITKGVRGFIDFHINLSDFMSDTKTSSYRKRKLKLQKGLVSGSASDSITNQLSIFESLKTMNATIEFKGDLFGLGSEKEKEQLQSILKLDKLSVNTPVLISDWIDKNYKPYITYETANLMYFSTRSNLKELSAEQEQINTFFRNEIDFYASRIEQVNQYYDTLSRVQNRINIQSLRVNDNIASKIVSELEVIRDWAIRNSSNLKTACVSIKEGNKCFVPLPKINIDLYNALQEFPIQLHTNSKGTYIDLPINPYIESITVTNRCLGPFGMIRGMEVTTKVGITEGSNPVNISYQINTIPVGSPFYFPINQYWGQALLNQHDEIIDNPTGVTSHERIAGVSTQDVYFLGRITASKLSSTMQRISFELPRSFNSDLKPAEFGCLAERVYFETKDSTRAPYADSIEHFKTMPSISSPHILTAKTVFGEQRSFDLFLAARLMQEVNSLTTLSGIWMDYIINNRGTNIQSLNRNPYRRGDVPPPANIDPINRYRNMLEIMVLLDCLPNNSCTF